MKNKITEMPEGGNPLPEESYEETYEYGSAGNRDARYFLSKKLFKAGDAAISYRILNHWSEIGLIDDEREKDAGSWRRLSVFELVWIKILKELREFGFPLEKLQTTKRTLIDDEFCYRAFEAAIGACINYVPCFITVDINGNAEAKIDQDLEIWDWLEQYPNQIRISLNKIWYEITGESPEPFLKNLKKRRSELAEQEREVINAMRQKPSKITITRAKASWLIDTTKNIQGAAHIAELLRNLDFGKIVLTVENGKQVASEVTKRKKK